MKNLKISLTAIVTAILLTISTGVYAYGSQVDTANAITMPSALNNGKGNIATSVSGDIKYQFVEINQTKYAAIKKYEAIYNLINAYIKQDNSYETLLANYQKAYNETANAIIDKYGIQFNEEGLNAIKGLWITVDILLNKELSDKEKITLSMIVYLSEEKGSCFASNKYISNIVNVTPERVSKIISSLKNKEYVRIKLKYKTDSKEIEERQITPIVKNINRYSEKFQEGIDNNNYSDSEKQPYPIEESNKEIINNIKNKNNYNKESHIKKNNKANFEQ